MHSKNSPMFFLCLLVFFFGLTNVGSFTAATNTTVAPYFGVTVGRMATLNTAYFLPFVLLAPLCGYLGDLWGRKRMILYGGTAFGVGLLLFGYSRNLMMGQVAHFITGTGGAIVDVVVAAAVADLYRENPARGTNFAQVFFGVGALASPALVAHLLEAHDLPWQMMYFAGAIGAVLLTSALFTQGFPAAETAQPPSAETEPRPRPAGSLLLSGTFLALVLAMFSYGCAEMGAAYGVPAYLEKGLGSSKGIAGLSLSGFWAFITLGRLLGSVMPKKASYPAVMGWGCLAGAICLAVASLARSATVAAPFFPLMGFSIAVIWPTILADARRRIPQRSTTAFGILVAAGGLGAMSFPLVVGRLSEATGDWHKAMQAILIPMALMLLMFAALSAFDRVRGRRQ